MVSVNSFQFPVSSCQFPKAFLLTGNWQLLTGNCYLATGNWQLILRPPRPRRDPARREDHALVAKTASEVGAQRAGGTGQHQSNPRPNIGMRFVLGVTKTAPGSRGIGKRGEAERSAYEGPQGMLILDGRVRQPAAEYRSADDTLVEKRMSAQQRHPGVSRSGAWPQVERGGNARGFETGGDQPRSAVELTS